MSRPYIDFISAYCDSWCERCAFTERCSAFAVKTAFAMCDGDKDAALELALGTPRVPGRGAQKGLREHMAEALAGYEEPSEQELDKIGREMEARRERIRRHPVAKSARDYSVGAHRWLSARETGGASGDTQMRESIEIVGWDSSLIHAKVMRALSGREEDPRGRFWGSRIQNDWNGSAKVALISIERSERAWRAIAAASADEGAGALAGMLAALGRALRREFPRAMAFRRPGFDDSPGTSR